MSGKKAHAPYSTRKDSGLRKPGNGEIPSAKYPGVIDLRRPDKMLKKTYISKAGKLANQYFFEASCSYCFCEYLCDAANFRKHKNSFCSKACHAGFVRAVYDGGKIKKKRVSGGYHVLQRKKDHPSGSNHGMVAEHRLIIESAIGRYLTRDEKVHHINCVKHDNRLENLFLCANNAEHLKIHGSLNRCVAELIECGALYFDRDSKTYRVCPPLPVC